MIWPMFRITRDNFFKKRFPKLDFLLAVSVTIIANSDRKWNWRKPISPTTFAFTFLSRFGFPTDFVKNYSPYPSFETFIPYPSKQFSTSWKFVLYFVYIFIANWNFSTKFCSSDLIFKRNVLTFLYSKSETSAHE